MINRAFNITSHKRAAHKPHERHVEKDRTGDHVQCKDRTARRVKMLYTKGPAGCALYAAWLFANKLTSARFAQLTENWAIITLFVCHIDERISRADWPAVKLQ
jgi:hypothetical protein